MITDWLSLMSHRLPPASQHRRTLHKRGCHPIHQSRTPPPFRRALPDCANADPPTGKPTAQTSAATTAKARKRTNKPKTGAKTDMSRVREIHRFFSCGLGQPGVCAPGAVLINTGVERSRLFPPRSKPQNGVVFNGTPDNPPKIPFPPQKKIFSKFPPIRPNGL